MELIGELDGTGTALRILTILHNDGEKVVKRVGEIGGVLKKE